MNVSLTPELERAVQDRVASGLYNNASEVMRDALRLMLKRDELGQMYSDWLRAEIEIGWQAATRGEFRWLIDPETIDPGKPLFKQREEKKRKTKAANE